MSQLKVVLHGLISLVLDPANNKIRALLIAMPEHRVAAGNWLAEISIPKGCLLELAGVAGGTPASAPFDPTKNILAREGKFNEPLWNEYRYAEIVFPWPAAIYSLYQRDLSPVLAGETETGAKVISEAQVFQYEIQGRAELKGDSSTSWRQYFLFTTATDATLHILNEPEIDPRTEHVVQEFRQSAEIFDSDLAIQDGVPSIAGSDNPDVRAAGIQPDEMLPLSKRQGLAQRIGDAVRKQTVIAAQAGSEVGGRMVCAGTNSN